MRDLIWNLSVQQIMSYSKSSLSHYHTSAKKATNNLRCVGHTQKAHRSFFPFRRIALHTCAFVRLSRKRGKQTTRHETNLQTYTKYLYLFCYLFGHCLCILSRSFVPVLGACHCIASNRLSMHRIPNAFQLFATYVLFWMAFMFSLGRFVILLTEPSEIERDRDEEYTKNHCLFISSFWFSIFFLLGPVSLCCVTFYSIS